MEMYELKTIDKNYITKLNEYEVKALENYEKIWLEVKEGEFKRTSDIVSFKPFKPSKDINEENMFNIDTKFSFSEMILDTVIFDENALEDINAKELTDLIAYNNFSYIYYYDNDTNITLEMVKDIYEKNNNSLFDITYIMNDGEEKAQINLTTKQLIQTLYDIKDITRIGYTNIFSVTYRKVLTEKLS